MTTPQGRDGKPASGGSPGIAEVGGKPPTADWRRYARFTLWGVLVILVALLLMRNSEPTRVDFVFFVAEVPLFLALGLTFALGLIIGGTFVWFSQRRRRRAALAKK